MTELRQMKTSINESFVGKKKTAEKFGVARAFNESIP